MTDEDKKPFETQEPIEVPLTPPLSEPEAQPVTKRSQVIRSDNDRMTTDSNRFETD